MKDGGRPSKGQEDNDFIFESPSRKNRTRRTKGIEQKRHHARTHDGSENAHTKIDTAHQPPKTPKRNRGKGEEEHGRNTSARTGVYHSSPVARKIPGGETVQSPRAKHATKPTMQFAQTTLDTHKTPHHHHHPYLPPLFRRIVLTSLLVSDSVVRFE